MSFSNRFQFEGLLQALFNTHLAYHTDRNYHFLVLEMATKFNHDIRNITVGLSFLRNLLYVH